MTTDRKRTTTQLEFCPCGVIPETLCITDDSRSGKWAFVYGACCGEWNIEFRTNRLEPSSPEYMELAIAAWNRAPREDRLG